MSAHEIAQTQRSPHRNDLSGSFQKDAAVNLDIPLERQLYAQLQKLGNI